MVTFFLFIKDFMTELTPYTTHDTSATYPMQNANSFIAVVRVSSITFTSNKVSMKSQYIRFMNFGLIFEIKKYPNWLFDTKQCFIILKVYLKEHLPNNNTLIIIYLNLTKQTKTRTKKQKTFTKGVVHLPQESTLPTLTTISSMFDT